jgi:hypothetical protein
VGEKMVSAEAFELDGGGEPSMTEKNRCPGSARMNSQFRHFTPEREKEIGKCHSRT